MMFSLPSQVNRVPWRALRLGMTQSKKSTPRYTASSILTGVPTPTQIARLVCRHERLYNLYYVIHDLCRLADSKPAYRVSVKVKLRIFFMARHEGRRRYSPDLFPKASGGG